MIRFNAEVSIGALGSGSVLTAFDNDLNFDNKYNEFSGMSPSIGGAGSVKSSYTEEVKSPMNMETLTFFNNKYPMFTSSYGKKVLAEVSEKNKWNNLYFNKISGEPVIIVSDNSHYQIYDVTTSQYFPVSEEDFKKYYERLVL